MVKEVYSNICMKIHISFKLTEYLMNNFNVRFLMRKCLKDVQQSQNGIFKKTCWTTVVPYSVMWISPRYCVHHVSMGNPLIPEAEKYPLRPFYSLNLKIGT